MSGNDIVLINGLPPVPFTATTDQNNPRRVVIVRADGLPIWSSDRGTPEAAERLAGWLRDKRERCLVWDRLVGVAGEDAVTGMIEREFGAAHAPAPTRLPLGHTVPRQAPGEPPRRLSGMPAEQVDEPPAHASSLHFYAARDGRRPKVEMQVDRKVVFTLTFGENWEIKRFRDWAWQQSAHYDHWTEHLHAHGGDSLERRLLHQMLRKEKEVRKAGLGCAGQRPLRFWRGDE